MSQQISVFIPCNIPTVTAQQKGAFAVNGKVRFFKKKKVKESETTFHALFYPHRPPTPFTGPVCLSIGLVFPWRKSEAKRIIRGFSRYPVQTRPDLSNLIKTIEDVMTTLRFWNDDGQISTLKILKCYGDNPGITLNVTEDLAMDKEGHLTSV
jgi:Holliday junction resolvase RusA-like endonuclease